MYISKKHKLLFIAVPRTASNSVQHALMNSDLKHSTDVVSTLEKPGDVSAINAYHMAPDDLIEQGLLTPEELGEYTTFGFVREPLERWVSSIFLARHVGVMDKTEDALTQITRLVREGNSPRPFGKHPRFKFGQQSYRPFSYKKYFFQGDTQVIDAYRFEDVEAVTNRLVSEKLGKDSSVTFPHIQVNPRGTPAKFKEPVESWLPSDCYEKIKAFFAEETAFYESVNYLSD